MRNPGLHPQGNGSFRQRSSREKYDLSRILHGDRRSVAQFVLILLTHRCLPANHRNVGEAGEPPQEPLRDDLDKSRENLLRFIRLEFAMAETLWELLERTQNKRQCKLILDDIRKAKVSIIKFKKKLDPQEGNVEVDKCVGKIDGYLGESSSPSVTGLLLRRLQQRVRTLRSEDRKLGSNGWCKLNLCQRW
jgi:hypothetical protein